MNRWTECLCSRAGHSARSATVCDQPSPTESLPVQAAIKNALASARSLQLVADSSQHVDAFRFQARLEFLDLSLHMSHFVVSRCEGCPQLRELTSKVRQLDLVFPEGAFFPDPRQRFRTVR